MKKRYLNKQIRLGYRIANSSIQRTSCKNKTVAAGGLNTAVSKSEENINEAKDILIWNGDKFRIFELSDHLAVEQSLKPQLYLMKYLHTSLTELKLWADEGNHRILIQTKPLYRPHTVESTKNLLDYLESLLYIIKIMGNDSSLIIRMGNPHDVELIKLLKSLHEDIRFKLTLWIEPAHISRMVKYAKELMIPITTDIVKVMEYYEDRVSGTDPLEYFIKNTNLLYFSAGADGSVDYRKYSTVRQRIFLDKNNIFDLVMPTHVCCTELMKEVYNKKPMWRYIDGKNYY